MLDYRTMIWERTSPTLPCRVRRFYHLWGGIAVDEDQIPAMEIMDKRSSRIDREGSSCDDEHIGIDNSIQAFINGFAIKLFFIENNIRLDKTAAGTAGNAGRGEDLLR